MINFPEIEFKNKKNLVTIFFLAILFFFFNFYDVKILVSLLLIIVFLTQYDTVQEKINKDIITKKKDISVNYNNFIEKNLKKLKKYKKKSPHNYGQAMHYWKSFMKTLDTLENEDLYNYNQYFDQALIYLQKSINLFQGLGVESYDRKYIDGQDIPAGETIALISGSARVLLSGERTALNLLGRMSGISTMTRNLSLTVKNYKARIVCTRKTAPGLRLLDKYSVRAGGGVNHRFGLGDGILIKDNHRLIAGGISNAVESVRKRLGHMVKLEVEVDTLAQLQEVLDLGVDAVLLDNMTPSILADAVSIVDGRVLTEASGGITPEKVTEVAATGVDLISLGWLTHSVKNWDVGLDFEP